MSDFVHLSIAMTHQPSCAYQSFADYYRHVQDTTIQLTLRFFRICEITDMMHDESDQYES